MKDKPKSNKNNAFLPDFCFGLCVFNYLHNLPIIIENHLAYSNLTRENMQIAFIEIIKKLK